MKALLAPLLLMTTFMISCSDSSSSSGGGETYTSADLSSALQRLVQTMQMQNDMMDSNFRDSLKGGSDYTQQEIDAWWSYELSVEENYKSIAQMMRSSKALRDEFCSTMADQFVTAMLEHEDKIREHSKGWARMSADLNRDKDQFLSVTNSTEASFLYISDSCNLAD